MGCTPSTPGNGTSRTPDAGAGSKVAIFPSAKSGAGEVSSPNSLTYPSISDQESHECAYGRLFSCCWNCKEPSHTRCSKGRSDSSAKRISASLTGLHSLEPESTGLASNSGICTPKWHLNSIGRSSCASLCSVCSSATPLETSSGGQVCKQQQRQHQQEPTGRHLPGEGILVSCNVNSSELNCASQKVVSSRTKCHLSATISEHLLEGTNSGRSSDIANKGEKKRKMQTKSKLSKEMRLKESESLPSTKATLNSKDRHNHPAMVSYLTDTVSKEWTPPSEATSTCHCCVKHEHRSYRQGASHHPPTCTACPHQCCFPRVSPVASALELQSNQLQSENAASALNSSNNHSPMATSAALHQSSVCYPTFCQVLHRSLLQSLNERLFTRGIAHTELPENALINGTGFSTESDVKVH